MATLLWALILEVNLKKLLILLMLLLLPSLAISQYVSISGNYFVDGNGNQLQIKGVWLEPFAYNWATWWNLSLAAFEADIDKIGRAHV